MAHRISVIHRHVVADLDQPRAGRAAGGGDPSLKRSPFHDLIEAAYPGTPWEEWADYNTASQIGQDPAAELATVRTGAVMFDMSPVVKYSVKGPDAEQFLNLLTTRQVCPAVHLRPPAALLYNPIVAAPLLSDPSAPPEDGHRSRPRALHVLVQHRRHDHRRRDLLQAGRRRVPAPPGRQTPGALRGGRRRHGGHGEATWSRVSRILNHLPVSPAWRPR